MFVNTVAKILGAAVHVPLEGMASKFVFAQQRCLIKDRLVTDNILETEAAALSLAMKLRNKAAILSFDFMAASSSIAHEWIFHVLKRMRLST